MAATVRRAAIHGQRSSARAVDAEDLILDAARALHQAKNSATIRGWSRRRRRSPGTRTRGSSLHAVGKATHVWVDGSPAMSEPNTAQYSDFASHGQGSSSLQATPSRADRARPSEWRVTRRRPGRMAAILREVRAAAATRSRSIGRRRGSSPARSACPAGRGRRRSRARRPGRRRGGRYRGRWRAGRRGVGSQRSGSFGALQGPEQNPSSPSGNTHRPLGHSLELVHGEYIAPAASGCSPGSQRRVVAVLGDLTVGAANEQTCRRDPHHSHETSMHGRWQR
jgi:hypothetical protein